MEIGGPGGKPHPINASVGYTSFFKGWIYEIFVWDEKVTSADRTALHAYAAAEYSIGAAP
jgi:hypothetical protein